jgi:hypothetical protein
MRSLKAAFLFLLISISFNFELISQQVEDLGYFGDIVNFHFIDSSSVAIVSNNFENHVSVYSLNTKTITRQYIPVGRGPGEALSIESSAYSENKLYLKEANGQITTIDLLTHEISEKFALSFQSNFMTTDADNLVLGSKFIVNPNYIDRYSEPIKVGHILDKETLAIKNTILFDLKKLKLSSIRNINQIESFLINAFIQPVSTSEYFLTFEGFNKIFVIDSTSVVNELKITLPNIFPLSVVKHASYGHGVKSPASFSNFFMYNVSSEANIAFSYGNKIQSIPYGYAVYQPHLKNFSYNYIEFDPEIIDGTYSFKKYKNLILGYEKGFGNLYKFN